MELVCINCPLGCHLTATKNGDEIVVTGNNCPRGAKYATDELTCPKRTLTSTVKINNSTLNSLPVITSTQIPKEKMFEVMRALKGVTVEAPVENGQVIIKNVCGLDADIIASKAMVKVS